MWVLCHATWTGLFNLNVAIRLQAPHVLLHKTSDEAILLSDREASHE